ncbi:NAD(P)/FAD-dependent oxidoreductase [Bacillus tuaregi]|uniref:NAD(P)/FAD-dependent oxidoreductase n=1 Tax=Bacillus tuaregi TaxID=1816695 RepID=UPI0008F8628A|nr:NAD(P)/FAD-dependent oxidoreductase [Bacillus tuaregi]
MIILLKPKIVILGAGYAGLMTLTRLQKTINVNEAEIILVNKHDYHYETTWLHHAAAGTLHHDRVRFNINNLIDRNKVKFIQGTVVEINTDKKKVRLENDEVSYDYLVVALGGESETFGIKGLKEHSFAIVSVNAARKIRNHIEYQFATYHTAGEKTEDKLTIVVGGAGFTGMEFLGEMTDRIPKLCRDYDIKENQVKFICVEATDSPLTGFDTDLVSYAMAYLEGRGVQFKLNTEIRECTPGGVIIQSGDEQEEIKARTVIWSAGIRGSTVIDRSGFEAKRGRVVVQPDLRAPGLDNVFIIGDCSIVLNKKDQYEYPPTAQIAMQQGITCANNLSKLIRKKADLETFVPNIRGSVCSLGENNAIGIVYGKKLFGPKALFMKKVIDNRALYMMGGASLVFKKGKLNLFG